MTPHEILALPIEDSDIGATTVGGYLTALLLALWEDGEGFSGKRPFGNSGWEYDLYIPLVTSGVVQGNFDADGSLEDFDVGAARRTIKSCIEVLGAGWR